MKQLSICAIAIFLSYALTIHGQSEPQTIRNNFEKVMSIEDPTLAQLDSILQFSYYKMFSSQDTGVLIAQKAFFWSGRLYPEDTIHADVMLQLGDTHRIGDDLEIAEPYYHQGKTLYLKLGLEGKAAKADIKLGALNKSKGEYEVAMDYYIKAMEVYESKNDSNNVYRPYLSISEVFYLLGRKDKALEYNTKAMEIGIALDLRGVKLSTYQNQGTVQKELGMDYISKADTFPENEALYIDSADYYFTQSLESFQFPLAVSSQSKNRWRYASVLYEIADLQIQRKVYDEAIRMSKKGLELSIDLGSRENTIKGYFLTTTSYRKSGQLASAIRYGEAGLALEKHESTDMVKSDINYELYLAYKNKNNSDLALKNLEAYRMYKEKANEIEQNKIVSDVEAKYQNAEKQQQLLAQDKDILELEKTNTKITTQRNNIIGGSVALGLLGLLGFNLIRIRRERNDKKDFAEALIYAQEEEKKRIARDLHDGIGQSLLLIKKQMDSTRDNTLINQKLIGETLEEVRTISQNLHPFQLEKFGLTAAIEETLFKIEKSTGLFINKEIENVNDLNLPNHTDIYVYRIIQEGLSNIVKHAEATAVKVTLKAEQGFLKLEIRDNGKGFDHELAIVTSKSLGLRTMNERITGIGGRFRIAHNDPQGTLLDITIPIN